MNWAAVAEAVHTATGTPFQIKLTAPVGGGCINESFKISDGERSYFVKTNQASWLKMFVAESEGLRELADAGTIQVPRPICYGISQSRTFLVLEFLSLRALDSTAKKQLGKQLAAMHRQTSEQFGWYRNNTIGSTSQENGWMDNWLNFYAERRLRPQFELAAKKGLNVEGAVTLFDAVSEFFLDYHPQPSLLHGDLWSGNAAMNESGNPVLFDPACYYGDRETDLAFTEMFGGFADEFYTAYTQEWPLHAGYQQRKDLYNLYHVLNHYNLFGGDYGSQAQRSVKSLLGKI